MALIKCKMCGGDLALEQGQTVAECEYCGSKQTVPSVDNEKIIKLFERAGKLLRNCEFDKAAGVFETIVSEFYEEAEAYWGLLLCRYGIEYVDDPVSGKKIPTCHRSSFTSILDDKDFELVLENADAVSRRVYREEAKTIEELRKQIIEVSGKEDPYDIFVCYKETDENGQRTLDSVLSQDLYEALTEKGYRVFFARITLEDKLGQEYEPYIFAALHSAKIMLAVGTDYEYYNAVWVKNEWSRFLQLIAAGEKKTLIPCYKSIDAYDMPKEFARLQAQDLGKVGAIQDLLRGIGKILDPARVLPKQSSDTIGAQTQRGYFALEDGDFTGAHAHFERALDENPMDSKAYVGKVLCALRKTSVEQIDEVLVNLETFNDYKRAMQFAVGNDAVVLNQVKEHADRKYLIKCFTIGLKKIAMKNEEKERQATIQALYKEGTVKALETVKELYREARSKRLGWWISPEEETVERQIKILQFLTNNDDSFSSQAISKSKYFSGTYPNQDRMKSDLKHLVEMGTIETEKVGTDASLLQYCAKGALQRREEKRKIEEARQEALRQEAEKKRQEEEARQEALHREAEKKRQEEEARQRAEEEKRQAEIKRHNDALIAEINRLKAQKQQQESIYKQNEIKIFGAGAKAKRAAKEEIAKLESQIAKLRQRML